MNALTAAGIFTEMVLKRLRDLNAMPAAVYINGRRVHHGEIGLALEIAGRVLKIPELADAGHVLAKDDEKDVQDWFTFKPMPEDLKKQTSRL